MYLKTNKEENNLFKGQCYITRSIVEEINKDIQNYIWKLIENRVYDEEELDYLQVFDLYIENINGTKVQKIVHKQEKPNYIKANYTDEISEPVHGMTIWVIDDGSHTTMMLPKDY